MCESLETRAMLTGELVEIRLETTDQGGTPVSEVSVGQAVTLNAYVQDVRDTPTGVFSAYMDVLYDQSLVSVDGPIVHSGDYPNGRSGDTSTAGLVDEAGGFDGFTPLGGDEYLLFSLSFQTDAAGEVTFQSEAADLSNHPFLVFGSDDPLAQMDVLYGAHSLTISAVVDFEAVDDEFDVFENTQDHQFDVLFNDELGSAGGPLEIIGVTDPDNGGDAQIVNDEIVYSPAADTTGTETFVYTVRDPSNTELQATVTVNIASNSSAQIGDRVWRDLNLDGVQNAGEPGQQGVDVELFDAGGDGAIGGGDDTSLATTTTDVDGLYSFTSLTAGNYFLEFSDVPSGLEFSSQDEGGNDALDSDADPATGRTAVIALGNGETIDHVDAGLTQMLTTETARFDLGVVLDPTTTDGDGQIDVVPDSAVWIHEWHRHWIEVWVSTPGTGDSGVTSATVHLDYDTSIFTATTVQAGPAFAGGLTSSVDDGAGRIELQGTKTAVASVGVDNFVLLARIQMEATNADAGVAIDLGESAPISAVGQPWIEFADDGTAAAQLEGAAADVELGDAAVTDLYAVLYDLDDDGRIAFGDLSIFSGVFLANVTDSPVAYKSDFDLDDRVAFGDLSLFSTNFFKDRSTGDEVIMPPEFPSGFALSAASASAAPSSASALMADESVSGAALPVSGETVVSGGPIVTLAQPEVGPSTTSGAALGTSSLAAEDSFISVESRIDAVELSASAELLIAESNSTALRESRIEDEWFSRMGAMAESTADPSSYDLDEAVLDNLFAALGQ